LADKLGLLDYDIAGASGYVTRIWWKGGNEWEAGDSIFEALMKNMR
jgi:hypothetical protein